MERLEETAEVDMKVRGLSSALADKLEARKGNFRYALFSFGLPTGPVQ
jgi:hypothetical protein